MELPNETIRQAVHDIIKQNGLVNYKIEVSSGCAKENNSTGFLLKVAVTGFKGFSEKATLDLFCKTSSTDKETRQKLSVRNCYLREIQMYEEVLKEMKKLEIEKGVKSGFTSFSKYISGSTAENQEFLIMEDLTKRNFAMFAKGCNVDLAHTQLVMRGFAKFHALSFALKDQKPELFIKLKKEMSEIFYRNDGSKFLLDSFLNKAVEKQKFEGNYKDKWENFCKNYHHFIEDCTNGETAEPYAVLCHGNSRNNNMMFQYENGVPVEVCLLDWQTARYSSPILDLVTYIFCSTDRPFRELYYNTLLNIYYDCLSNFLKELGSSPEILFPYSVFQEHLEKYGKFGLIVGVIGIPIFVSEMCGFSGNLTDPETTKVWNNRLTEVVEEMVDFNYL